MTRYIAVGIFADKSQTIVSFDRIHGYSTLDSALGKFLEHYSAAEVEKMQRIEVYPVPEAVAVASDNPPVALDRLLAKYPKYREKKDATV